MRGGLFIGFLIMVAAVAGYPYVNFVIDRILGTGPVVFIEHDGTQRTLIMGPSAPRPEWFPIMPSSVVVTAAHWVPGPNQAPAGDVDLLSHASLGAIKAYYMEQLREVGFDMRDAGVAPLTPALASWLGIAGMLQGWRQDTNVAITLTVRSTSGLIMPSRSVELHWQVVAERPPAMGPFAGPPTPSGAVGH